MIFAGKRHNPQIFCTKWYFNNRDITALQNPAVLAEPIEPNKFTEHAPKWSSSADPLGELDVTGHERDSARVDRAELSVLHQSDEKSFCRLLQGLHCVGGPSKLVCVNSFRDFFDEPSERQPSYQQVRRSLIPQDFTAPAVAGSEFFALRTMPVVMVCRCCVAGCDCGPSLLSKNLRHWTLTAEFLMMPIVFCVAIDHTVHVLKSLLLIAA
jgi:hypothetical protein